MHTPLLLVRFESEHSFVFFSQFLCVASVLVNNISTRNVLNVVMVGPACRIKFQSHLFMCHQHTKTRIGKTIADTNGPKMCDNDWCVSVSQPACLCPNSCVTCTIVFFLSSGVRVVQMRTCAFWSSRCALDVRCTLVAHSCRFSRGFCLERWWWSLRWVDYRVAVVIQWIALLFSKKFRAGHTALLM